MKKKIIGYKLKNKEYYKASSAIMYDNYFGSTALDDYIPDALYIHGNNQSINKLQEAGVLDLWFEPVYKFEYSLPKINGYCGETKFPGAGDDGIKLIKYGCALLNVYQLRKIYNATEYFTTSGAGNCKIQSIKLNFDVEITMDQIKQILDYVDNQ